MDLVANSAALCSKPTRSTPGKAWSQFLRLLLVIEEPTAASGAKLVLLLATPKAYLEIQADIYAGLLITRAWRYDLA